MESMESMEARREAAIQYLKSRGKYLLDGKFRPTSAAATNVGETIKQYQQQIRGKRKS